MTEPVGRPTDLPEQPWLVPVHDLRTDDPHVLHTHADRRFHETRHRVGVEGGVIVQYQEVVGGPRRGDLERRTDRARQTAVTVGCDDAPVAERLPQEVR